MNKNIFLFSTFGLCENNSYLATRLLNYFKINNFKIVKKSNLSDVIVVCTCAFDNDRENNTKRMINRYIKHYLGKKLIVIVGCLPKIAPEFGNDDGIIKVGVDELHLLNEIFNSKILIENVKGNELNPGLSSFEYGFNKDYYVQISQGCVNNCSYCAIKKAKGNVKSKPINNIILEIKEGIKLGYKRFVLLADDCGSYGLDIGINFADLLNNIVVLHDAIKFNIHYIYPAQLINLFDKIDKKVWDQIYFLNAPIQSTSKKLIKLMNRNYNITIFLNLIKKIKKLSPDIRLETHILYCFPGETRENFLETLKLDKFFDLIIYFYYTDKKYTKSINFKNKICKSELMYRTNIICELIKINKHFKFGFDYTNKELFESINKNYLIENPHLLLIYPKSNEDNTISYPLGLLSISQKLLEEGYHVKILDQRLESNFENKIINYIENNNLVCISFSLVTGPQIKSMIKTIELIKNIKNIPIVVGGPHVTMLPN
ncbi:radical SAM protein, partial [Candidatus Woesearchaeota archaeon]|nr:radical SAM protein [Candidatus Woesearchaeota archaeon]